jgi:hypothetical protein
MVGLHWAQQERPELMSALPVPFLRDYAKSLISPGSRMGHSTSPTSGGLSDTL